MEVPIKQLLSTVTDGVRGLADGWFDLAARGGRGAGGRGTVELRVQYRGYQ